MSRTKPKPCTVGGCGRPKLTTRSNAFCQWHWLLRQPIERQVTWAHHRLAQVPEGVEHRARVPAAEWPDGERWCAGCQSFVPLFYVTGSRCKACNSEAAHASRVKAVYDITAAEYRAMLALQDGRCFVCGRKSTRRLAVDHDHVSGRVRGLLCPDVERGCNHAVLGNLEASSVDGGLAAARRLVAYLEHPPYDQIAEDRSDSKIEPDPPPAAVEDDLFAGF